MLGGVRNTTNLVEEWVQNDKAGFGGDDDVANEALKFLVHFVGDMHMPLHLTGRDRGGNSVKVKFDGRQTSELALNFDVYMQLTLAFRPSLALGLSPHLQIAAYDPSQLHAAPSLSNY